MKKITFLIFTVFCNTFLQAQKPLILILHYEKSDFFKDSFYLQIAQPVNQNGYNELIYNSKILSDAHAGNTFTTIAQYDIPDTTCAIFKLGFGHEIVVIPGDTMEITINPQTFSAINQIYPSPWMNEFSYSGSNKYITSLFDSLAYVSGELKWNGIPFSKANNNIDSFYSIVTADYRKRMSYLNYYSDKYKIPDHIKAFGQCEIYAAYYLNLLIALNNKSVRKAELPLYYLKTLDEPIYNFNYWNLVLSRDAAYGSALYHNQFSTIDSLYRNKGLIDVYNYIKATYNGKIRCDLITHHLSTYLQAPYNFPSFDSLFSDFKAFCSDSGYIFYLTKNLKKKRAEVFKKISFVEALSSEILDQSGKKLRFKNQLQGRPVVIDCWASWCLPCIHEMPFAKEFERKYQDKIDFIYLSFDRNKNNWIKKVKELKLNGKIYLLTENFRSDFAKYFNITSIPRYIMFDKTGKPGYRDSVRPSQKDDFDRALGKLVNIKKS